MLRFSIRELMLVTVVVALISGWAVDHVSNHNEVETWRFRAEACADKVRSLGWKVRFMEDGVSISLPK